LDRVQTEEEAKARLVADGFKVSSGSDVLDLYIATYLQQKLKAGQSREESYCYSWFQSLKDAPERYQISSLVHHFSPKF